MKSIEYFGAVGDGSTDNTTALQDAYNSGETALYVPSGRFCFGGTITISTKVKTYGDGMYHGALVATDPAQNMFLVTTQDPVRFLDMDILAVSMKTAGRAITIDTGSGTQNNYSEVRGVRFKNQFQAVDFARAAYWKMVGCHFQYNGGGGTVIRIRNLTTPDSGDQVFAFNQFYGGDDVTFVRYEGGGGLRAIGNKFLGGTNGIDLSFASGAVTGIMALLGNSFDGQSSTALSMTNVDGLSSFTNFVINENVFDGGPSNAFIYVESIGGSGAVGRGVIGGNVMIRNSGTAPLIHLVSGGNFNVSGNALSGAGGDAGIIVRAGVSNSLVAANQMQGLTILNQSATTTVIQQPDTAMFPSLLNGWSNYGAPCTASTYRRDASGTVHIGGRIRGGSGVIFTLPDGYRPPAEVKFLCAENNSVSVVKVTPDGNVSQVTGGNTELALDGIAFTTS